MIDYIHAKVTTHMIAVLERFNLFPKLFKSSCENLEDFGLHFSLPTFIGNRFDPDLSSMVPPLEDTPPSSATCLSPVASIFCSELIELFLRRVITFSLRVIF